MTETDIKRIQDKLQEIAKTTAKGFEFIYAILKNEQGLYPFEEFWNAWRTAGGKKLGLHECRALYSTLDEITRRRIFVALVDQRNERQMMKEHGANFIPQMKNPATWLRKKSWLDEISTEQEVIDEINARRTIAAHTRPQQAIDACWDDKL